MATAIVVASGKGGTGKTTFTAGVASCLAALGNRVLCIDMDIGLRNLDMALGMTDCALMDFSDVISGACPLKRAAAAHPAIPGLHLLTAPLTLHRPVTPIQMAALIATAKEQFDYILIDAPAGLGLGFRLAVQGADRGVVVSTTDPAALRDASRTVLEARQTLGVLHLVMNRVQPRLLHRLRTNLDEAMNTAGLPLLGVVPEDSRVALAAGLCRPVVLTARKGAAVAYLNIAKRIMGLPVPLMRIRKT